MRNHSIPGVAHARVVAVRGHVILYRTRGPTFDTLWVCSRGHGRGARIGIDSARQAGTGSIYPPEWTLGRVQVAGNWAMVTQEEGAAQLTECSKYAAYPCPGITYTVVLANAALGLNLKLASIVTEKSSAAGYAEETASLSRTLLSSSGAVAWLEKSKSTSATTIALYGCLARVVMGKIACSTLKVADGNIDPESLRLAGTTLTWTAGGQPQSATLR